MVAGWMLYCVLVSALLLGAGMLLEAAARRVALPQRWIWAGAMSGSVLLPILARFRPDPAANGFVETALGDPIAFLAPAGAAAAEPIGRWPRLLDAILPLDPLLVGLWLGASLCLLAGALLSALRLRRAMIGWEEPSPRRPRLLVSEATGPAVIGLFPGSIVLPRWAFAGDAGVRGMMLAHEEEHLRARDPLLLLAAATLVVALPWNLPLWWQLRQLRLAVEVDCDSRVLRRGSDLRSYATLLMEVGRRRAGLDPALLALAEPSTFLERRIRLMTTPRGRRGWVAAAALATVALAFVVGACRVDEPADQARPEPAITGPETPTQPTATEAPGDGAAPAEAGAGETRLAEERLPRRDAAPSAADRSPVGENPVRRLPRAATGATPSETEPEFSPRDREPALQNRVEFARRLEELYPPLLKDAGVGGRVLLWVRIDATGAVTNVRIYESSGQEQLDRAAMQALRTAARFSPGSLREEPVTVWVALPVTFRAPEDRPGSFAPRNDNPSIEVRQEGPDQRAAITLRVDPEDLTMARRPTFTPREVEPQLRNREDFAATLERLYPAALKQAGIGGRTLLWVFVTEQGLVSAVRIYESSGTPQLDGAAVEAMRTAEFSPAENRGEPVPVWIALPVTFQSNR